MAGLFDFLGSFGTIPDILMGKDPKEAFLDNLKAAAVIAAPMAAPGLLGAAGGATAGFGGSAAGTQAGMLAAQEAGLGATSLGWGGATTGVQGGLNSVLGADMGAKAGGLLSTANSMQQPVGIAMQAADAVKPEPEQLPPPPVPQMPNYGGASQTLAQIAQQPQQMAMQQQQIDEAKKQRRMGLLSRMA